METSKPEPACRTLLLADEPADADAFSGGAHQRLASTLAQMVIDEPVGRAVALQGSWGVGKSTVIRLLRKELGDQDDIEVFAFDAWAHEGDPLRRTFLESLIERFAGKWIDRSTWDKR